MSLTFPLTQAEFIDLLPVGGFAIDCPARVETAITASGEQLDREIGPRLWQGSISLGLMTANEAVGASTLIDLVRGSGASFRVHDLFQPYPLADPDGVILGAAAPKVTAIASDRRTITVGSLPANYILSRGDMLGFTYGSAPLRRTLHRIVTGVTASGAGSGAIEVLPALPAAILTNALVLLKRPTLVARIVSGSVRPGTRTRFVTEGMSFAFAQTMR